jgi:hypothetical protein
MSWEDDEREFEDELDRQIVAGDIPPDFQSVYLSGPFRQCIDCESGLLDAGDVYAVIKAFVGRETIFEMAICARCSARLAESYSAQSKAAFEAAIHEWRAQSTEPAEPRPDDGGLTLGRLDQLEHCAACDRPRAACRRYSIVGTFLGRALVSPTRTPFRLPLLICDDCNGQMTANISRQTRDAWDRFVEEHFDGPPGIELDSPRLDPILI